MATIDPGQDYDVIHTLTFAVGSGTCAIRLYRGSDSVFSGTVYYRAGTSGSWTPLSVSGIATTFPVSSTTMQIGHAHNKDGNNYMTVSFRGPSTNLTGMAISQKAVYSGVMGDYFMSYYASYCAGLSSLAIPDTSGITSVGDYFMSYYAYDCAGLSSLAIPDTSGITSVGDYFMSYYAGGCSGLASLAIPDTIGMTSVGTNFMSYYARGCSGLASLATPDTIGMTSVGTNFMYNYARGCSGLASLAIPDTIGMTSVGTNFMYNYARDCISLLRLELPAAGRFVARNVTWGVPIERLGLLKGYVRNPTDLAAWQALTATDKTLWLNYVRSTGDVILEGAGGAGRLIGGKSHLIGRSPLIGGKSKLIG